MNKKQKNYKLVFIIGIAVLILLVLINSERQMAMSKVVSKKLKDTAISGEAVKSEFYSEQLTEREKKNYLYLKEAMENLQGGVMTLPEAVNGNEYMRIVTALENDAYNSFYALYDIPMTADNVYVKYTQKDILEIRDRNIEKMILFLSCAEGVDAEGDYAEDGTVQNLEEISEGLAVNTEEGVQEIQELQEQTE